MKKKETLSDDCVSDASIIALHHAIIRDGGEKPLNNLLERENALGAYVLFAGNQVSEVVKASGAPRELVAFVNNAVMAHALVCIESQRAALNQLWDEFLGDHAPDDSANEPNDPTKGK